MTRTRLSSYPAMVVAAVVAVLAGRVLSLGTSGRYLLAAAILSCSVTVALILSELISKSNGKGPRRRAPVELSNHVAVGMDASASASRRPERDDAAAWGPQPRAADEFEKLVLAYRTLSTKAEGADAQPISVGGSEEIDTPAHQPDGPSTEHASVRIGSRYASFDIPHGWAERTGVEISAMQAIEGDLATVHCQLYRFNNPDLIYALTILSTATPASMLTPENIPQRVLSIEQHTGLRAVSDVTPVSLDGAAGWLWHLQGVVPGTLFGRPQVVTMDVHCSEIWASVDASTAITMLLTAPRASAHEAVDGLSSVILSWQWGDVESDSRLVEQRSGFANLGDWWHRVGFRKDKLPS